MNRAHGWAVLGWIVLAFAAAAQAPNACFLPELVLEGTANRIHDLTPFQETLLFTFQDGEDRRLYRSDGTASGTLEIDPPAGREIYDILIATDDALYLSLPRTAPPYGVELWVLHGDDGSLALIHSNLQSNYSAEFRPAYSNGKVYFFGGQDELWCTDGTAEGTVLLHDFSPALAELSLLQSAQFVYVPGWLAPVAGGIVFAGADAETGVELWFSGGTPESTHELVDLVPACPDFPFFPEYTSGYPSFPYVQDEYVYFRAGDLQYTAPCPTSAYGIYRTDGTAEGTVKIEAMENSVVARAGDQEIFVRDGGIWALDAGTSDARLIRDHGKPLGFGPGLVFRLGEEVLYVAPDNYASLTGELWATRGTPESTRRLSPAGGRMTNVLDFNAPPTLVAQQDERVFFAMEDDTFGAELWFSDGSSRGTKLFRDLRSGTEGGFPTVLHFFSPPMAVAGDNVFFPGMSATTEGLWAAQLNPDAPEQAHSADLDGDFQIELTELLRAVQFFNSGGYHVEAGTEDGYAPGPGATAGTPHDSDYRPQDWRIDIFEVLRLIQLYNAIRCRYCVVDGTEDGFGV